MCGLPCWSKAMAQTKVYTLCLWPQSLQEFTPPYWAQNHTPLGEFTAVQHLGGQSGSGCGKTQDSILGEIPRTQERLQCVPGSSIHDSLIICLPFGCKGPTHRGAFLSAPPAGRHSFPSPSSTALTASVPGWWSLLMVRRKTWINTPSRTVTTTHNRPQRFWNTAAVTEEPHF